MIQPLFRVLIPQVPMISTLPVHLHIHVGTYASHGCTLLTVLHGRCPFFGTIGSPARESVNRKRDTGYLVTVREECIPAGEPNMEIYGHLRWLRG